MPKTIEPTTTYKVWYKLNPEYKGTFQVDKIGGGGLHAHVTPQMGGASGAQQQAARCKAWFNEEKIAVEKVSPQGKKTVDVKTTFHDNVIVWIEQYKDGFPAEEIDVCPPSVPVQQDDLKSEDVIALLKYQVATLTRRMEEMELDRDTTPARNLSREPEEALAELAGV